MPRTRNNPRVERSAFLRQLFRALVAGLVASALFIYEFDLRRLLIELTGTPTWRGIGIVPTFALLVGIVAGAFLAAAIRRLSRWLTALKHIRMLKDPTLAALVPPLPSHLQGMAPSLGRQILRGCGYVLMSAGVAVGVALVQSQPTSPTGSENPEDPFLAWSFALVLLCVSVYGLTDTVLRLRRARRAAWASREICLVDGDTAEQSVVVAPASAGATTIPSLTIDFTVPDDVSRERGTVTADRNVFGCPPWNIAYLRLFDNEQGLQYFLKGAWRQCGYVHFIRDADSVRGDELRAIDDGAPVFIDSRERLRADLDRRPADPLPPGERTFDRLAAEVVRVDDRYGSYPVYAPLCGDSFWKAAVDVLLERADVVVLDLSGYHWDNLGTGYELQRVVDRVPIVRCVFLADPKYTDKPFLEAQIQRAWSQMAGDSPNAGGPARAVVVAPQDHYGGHTSGALASMLQDRLERVASYATRMSALPPPAAGEPMSHWLSGQQPPPPKGKLTTLKVLLRLWGLTR